MSKKVTWLLVLMMGVAVIGLTSVQYYWVKESYQLKEKQFEQLVFQSIRNESYNIEKKRMLESIKNRQKIKQNSNKALEQLFNTLFFLKIPAQTPYQAGQGVLITRLITKCVYFKICLMCLVPA